MATVYYDFSASTNGAGLFYKQGNGSTQTFKYNAFDGVTQPYVDNSLTPISVDATDIVASLQLGPSYIPTQSSVLKYTGQYWGSIKSLDGKLRNNPPSIGAYEVIPVRATR